MPVKKKGAEPNMEELISKISHNFTKGDKDVWMSKIDNDYA